ncbi:sushi, von Willebrand factor type A, EGF and pentraxin domain-containing protein 1 isoform X1 [Kryptolebias marmoratus]|uniref:sushi, von Willebrand factor type A, EGF and pentraxin domain-containing protein 1 isoform X1 n=1 Tax=Kryptolebias marmoratus TaxID=37003 RepID=UPI000D5304BA|nr:sushi, von Willebrand factor type A, EGF and pentraxin domain-containing protein 1 isoform X1 [Kryptolebias marmoratus]
MSTMGLIVLLLLVCCSFQGGFPQSLEWNDELEVSGETEWSPQPDRVDDAYWSGSAPLCLGGCKARHLEVRKDRCGNSSCCWLGYKSLCRVNCGKPDVDYNGAVYGNDWWVGSVVRYTCRSGFKLVGSPTRSCRADGVWTPKPSCLTDLTCLSGMCQRGRIEISERELNGTCDSTCADKAYFGPPKLGCARIDNCQKKETGWKRFFAQCVPCICDCALSCASAG